jgi:hypothetical protein
VESAKQRGAKVCYEKQGTRIQGLQKTNVVYFMTVNLYSLIMGNISDALCQTFVSIDDLLNLKNCLFIEIY